MADDMFNNTETFNTTLKTTTISNEINQFLLSDYDSETIIFINRAVICLLIGTFGIITNFINRCVFVRQGLNTSVNISLFTIAAFDLVKIMTLQSTNMFSYAWVNELVGWTISSDTFYLIGGWPAACANRISMYITWYIIAERCLCISAPLKVKNLITPRVAVISLIFIVLINILTLIPEYSSIYIDWIFFSSLNRTALGLKFTSNRPAMQGVTFLIHMSFQLVGITLVVSLTILLVVMLKRKTKWRIMYSNDGKQTKSLLNHDQRTAKLVVLIATIVIICYSPIVVLSLVSVIVPDFNQGRKFSKLFTTVYSFVHILGIGSPSANIFIYYKMSSNFRLKFRECFQLCVTVKQ